MTRAPHASLQKIDKQTNRKAQEHTQDASLRYRHRHTDPQNFSSLGFIRAPNSTEYRVQRGMEWNGTHIMCQTDTLDQIAFMHARSQVPSP
jgi:hypothetical protein